MWYDAALSDKQLFQGLRQQIVDGIQGRGVRAFRQTQGLEVYLQCSISFFTTAEEKMKQASSHIRKLLGD